MRKLFASAALAASLLPMGAYAMNISAVDAWTNTTDRLISSELKDRVIELYTVKGTGERKVAWVTVISKGLHRHCVETLKDRGADTSVCNVIYSW